MAFQGFRVEYQQDRTIIYPYGAGFQTECIYIEESGDCIVHKRDGNKMEKVKVGRHNLTLKEIQELVLVWFGEKK
jgi:hypothetical protein